ncbi:MAG: PAS domain S-box protein [Pseudomonadales bacterium]|nr:PAS domain S-box protein [Pseudomonadales bacterium]
MKNLSRNPHAASIEALRSSNEELQCAHEELETSREKLQSLNEELSSVNNQLSEKVEELEHLNNDLLNLLQSSRIATVFLDRDLRLMRFTPASTDLFNFIDTDEGHPISDISCSFIDDTLLEDARRVMQTSTPLSAEILVQDGRFFLRRILPYRASQDRIEGVVITFSDITEAMQHKAAIEQMNSTLEAKVSERTKALVESEEFARSILRTAGEAIISIDASGIIDTFNEAAEQMFGYADREIIGKNISLLMPEKIASRHDGYLRRHAETRQRRIIGTVRRFKARRRDGTLFPIEISVGEIDHLHRFTGMIRDISERTALQRAVVDVADQEQRRLGQELHDGVQQELIGLGMLATNLVTALGSGADVKASSAQRIVDGIAQTVEHIRVAAKQLVAAEIESLGLFHALRALTRKVTNEHGICCEFDGGDPAKLAPSIASQLYRIAQEAISNAVKHADATSILVSLVRENSSLSLTVRDDGRGIAQDPRPGLGVNIMKYRAETLGGELEIVPGESGGTMVRCTVRI